MTIGGSDDLEALRRIGAIVAEARDAMLAAVAPGVSSADLDAIGAEILTRHGARSAPQLCYNFPAATCVSINEVAAHGIPGPQRLAAGDLVNVDVSAELDGFFADTGASTVVEPATGRGHRLCRAGQQALQAALAEVRSGAPLAALGRASEAVARRHGFRIIRNLCGHGLGRSLHEKPGAIPSYFDPRDRRQLHEGLVLAIEPFLASGAQSVHEAGDGWSLCTSPGSRSVQFEHSVVVTANGPLILTGSAAA